MLKTVLFDIGNVLFFFDHVKMIRQIGTCCGIDPEKLKSIFFEHQVQQEYEKGQINSHDVHQILQTYGTKKFTPKDWMEAASNIFTPNYALWPIVEKLKKEKVRLVLLSNTSEIHYNYLYSHYPILPLFDEKILSYEVKSSKPHPKIFQKALETIECPVANCFYTDDIPEFIDGARKIGIDSELYLSVPDLKRHLANRGWTC